MHIQQEQRKKNDMETKTNKNLKNKNPPLKKKDHSDDELSTYEEGKKKHKVKNNDGAIINQPHIFRILQQSKLDKSSLGDHHEQKP